MPPPTDSLVLRLGTRASLLAQTQSRLVAGWLEQRHPGLRVEPCLIRTSGDEISDRPLHQFGGKGLFTKELELALLAGSIDFAVHSFKDVPVTMPLVEQAQLVIACVPAREDPRDVIVSRNGADLKSLPAGARVGTGSLRRRCQILALRPDLSIEPIRGNIDTRLRRLRNGDFDAIVLARAGLDRAGLLDPAIMHEIDAAQVLCASGQGALALQSRRDDDATRKVLSALNDPATESCVCAERELVRLLEGDCNSPIAALAQMRGERMHLQAAVGAAGGSPPVIRAEAAGPVSDCHALARQVFATLTSENVAALLRSPGQGEGRDLGEPANS